MGEAEIAGFFTETDKNEDGKISLDEYLHT